MKYPFRISILFLVYSTAALAQPATSLGLSVDAASFRYDDFTTYVEVYYAISRSGITFQKTDNGYSGNVTMHTVLASTEKNAEPTLRKWNVPVHVGDTANMPDLRLIGLVNFALDAGDYTMFIAARDAANPAASDTMTLPVTARRFSGASAQFSDIQLAASIKQNSTDTNNIFYKNTLEVVPNPSALFGKQVPVLYYYAELYRYTGDTYGLRYEVVTSYGKTVLSKEYQKPGGVKAAVEIGAVNITKLPSGVYNLNLTCAEPDGELATAQTTKFYVYNPDIPIDTMEVRNASGTIAQEFAILTEEDLNERFAQAIYIAEKEEREIWEQISGSEAKKMFLTHFWDRRDSDRTTTLNEYYMDYQSRVAYATVEFRSAYMAGWKSDRGRVFIIYGAPDAIERDNSGMDAAPYEVWYYDGIEGGVGFVFVDRRNMGLFDLVHSTKQGETTDPSYDRLVR